MVTINPKLISRMPFIDMQDELIGAYALYSVGLIVVNVLKSAGNIRHITAQDITDFVQSIKVSTRQGVESRRAEPFIS